MMLEFLLAINKMLLILIIVFLKNRVKLNLFVFNFRRMNNFVIVNGLDIFTKWFFGSFLFLVIVD